MDSSADMAELADALVLGSSVHDVQVQVLLSAPTLAVFARPERPGRLAGAFCFALRRKTL